MAITIIGLPWSFAALRIGFYTLLPFGHEMRPRADAGLLSTLGNIVWFVLAGWWLAIIHVLLALALAITIIGLPFAWAHLKLAGASLARLARRSCRYRRNSVIAAPSDETSARLNPQPALNLKPRLRSLRDGVRYFTTRGLGRQIFPRSHGIVSTIPSLVCALRLGFCNLLRLGRSCYHA